MNAIKSNLEFVAGDTGPATYMRLSDPATELPIDLSDAGASALLRIAKVGATSVVTVSGTKLIGRVREDGTIDEAAPYDQAGKGGLVRFDYTGPNAVAIAQAGEFEAEVRITLPTGAVQTFYPILSFPIREPLPRS